jgi:predicted GNAT family acetyltransferase
MADRHQ